MRQPERHRIGRIGWLRAAVLGANDGIVSTASLLLGVAAANGTKSAVLVSGFAGLAAGALAMAAGEYVSVSSQADTERAELEVERREQAQDAEAEARELAEIYVARGVDPGLAQQVAQQLMTHDALGAHARDELGISLHSRARPLQAAIASAAAFATGATVPLMAVAASPESLLPFSVAGASLVCLPGLGALAARVGGAPMRTGALRVALWGVFAMAVTAIVGWICGVAV
jgi:VIT1/CCC1 family predicted Fe2+/Mn2+ transporter